MTLFRKGLQILGMIRMVQDEAYWNLMLGNWMVARHAIWYLFGQNAM